MNGLIHRLLDRCFKKREIVNCDRDIYLHRWFILRVKYLGIYIHKFVRSDEDRALHDHPWSFIVIPIWRGYIEHSEAICDCFYCENHPTAPSSRVERAKRVLPILGTRYRPATYRHRVELLSPCTWTKPDGYGPDLEEQCPRCEGRGEMPAWSIFIRFRKFREWGFWLPEGFQVWHKWWQEKCE